MTTAEETESSQPLVRVRVTADGDPSVLTRLLGYFQNLNVTPRQVHAEFGIQALMHISVDVFGMPVERVTLVTAKIGQTPCVLSAHWHYLA